MRSNAKRLGAVAAGILALCAAMAPAALAAPEFTGTETTVLEHKHVHTTVKGKNVGSLQFTAGEGFGGISCSVAEYEGTLPTGKDPHLTMEKLKLELCKDSFGRTVDTDAFGCQYTLKITEEVKGKPDEYKGSADIPSCGIGFTVTSGGSVVCTITVGAQTLLPVTITSNTDVMPTDVIVHVGAVNVKNTTSGGFFNCGISNGEHTNGTMTGGYTLQGYNKAGTLIDLQVSP